MKNKRNHLLISLVLGLSCFVYPNNLKNREFDKEAPQNFCLERVTIAGRQGTSEGKDSEAKPTRLKTDSSGCLGIAPLSINAVFDYPNFRENPLLDDRMQAAIAPYLVPLSHPMKPKLDSIFSQSRVIENEGTLMDAGFEIIAGPMPLSFIIVARHPEIPGYVFKLYLDSEQRCRKNTPHWLWLARRCAGALGIRKIIERKKIHFFSVPDKWLYVLPVYPYSSGLSPQPVILMETDMEPESYEVTKQMWKTVVTTKHLDELYSILKSGFGGHGTIFLWDNIPFTKKGKFAFTDTEDPRGELELKHIKKYLSKEMQRYWDTLINKSIDE